MRALDKYRAAAAAGAGTGLMLGSDESDASVSSLYDRGMKIRRLISDDPERFKYEVTDRSTGENVAGAEFFKADDDRLQGFSLGVNEPYRRQGIATEMYDAVEELSGRELTPSNYLTDEGLEFWMSRNPEAVKEMFNARGGLDSFPEGHKYVKALRNKYGNALSSLIPTATIGALSGMSAGDAGAATLDVANRIGEDFINTPLEGAQMLSNAFHDTNYAAPQFQFAPRTEAGNALSGALAEDTGRAMQFRGAFGEDLGLPSTADIIGGGVDLYNQYVSPMLSDRQEQALGGGGLALASLMGFGKGAKPVTRSSGILERVGDVDRVNSLDLAAEAGAAADLPVLTASDLINRPFVSNMADTSRGDNTNIIGVNGVPVRTNLQGGFQFMDQPQNIDAGDLWASDRGAVTGIMNAADEARLLPGAQGSPIMLPYSMTPGGSPDFAQFSADLAVQHARSLDPSTKRAIDKRIRSGSGTGRLAPVGQWVGIDKATPDYLTGLGGKRKNVLSALDEFRNEGALSLSEVRAAVSDRDIVDNYMPGQLLRAGEINLSGTPHQRVRHDTYNTAVPGSAMGRLNPGFSVLDVPNVRFRPGNTKSAEMGSFLLRDRPQYGQYAKEGKLSPALGKAMQSNLIGVLSEDVIEDMIRKGVILDK